MWVKERLIQEKSFLKEHRISTCFVSKNVNLNLITNSTANIVKNYLLTFINCWMLTPKMYGCPAALKMSMFRDHRDMQINTSPFFLYTSVKRISKLFVYAKVHLGLFKIGRGKMITFKIHRVPQHSSF